MVETDIVERFNQLPNEESKAAGVSSWLGASSGPSINHPQSQLAAVLAKPKIMLTREHDVDYSESITNGRERSGEQWQPEEWSFMQHRLCSI